MQSRTVRLISVMFCMAMLGLGLRITDPTWAHSIGIDIWNFDELLCENDEEDLRLMELEQHGEKVMLQYHLNQLMMEDLLANRRDLIDVADQIYQENKSYSGYAYMIGVYPSDMPVSQKAAEQILHRARQALYDRSDSEDVMTRLINQYVKKFGKPPLTNW